MKKFTLIAAALVAFLSANAQEKNPVIGQAIKENGFGDNWFIQVQAGASYTFSEHSKDADLFDLVSPHAAISLGKYFSPIVAGRIRISGWEAKSYLPQSDNTYKFNYTQASVDGLFSLTNMFLKYNPERVFNMSAMIGLGYVHGFKKSEYGIGTSDRIIPRAGLQFDFRVSDVVSLNLETEGNLYSDKFNGAVTGRVNDATANVMLGMTCRLGKRNFEKVDILDPAAYRSINDQLNAQRAMVIEKDRLLAEKDAMINNLTQQLAAKPKVEVKSQTEVEMNAVVVFRLGSARLEDNQEINIFNAAKYLQDNPTVKVLVTGYADKSTGNATINQRLSEQRAAAVKDILVSKYGIGSNRVATGASGDKVQPFQNDAWNRVVIFTVSE